MRIGFLPLDTRPCTYDFPVQLARLGGAEIELPPAGCLGVYKEESDLVQLGHWLEEIAPDCDALVLSAEQLLHGGLIPSRLGLASEAQLMERLAVIHRIKQKHPALSIYLSSVLMRTSISTLGPESYHWWQMVNRYSQVLFLGKTTSCLEAARERQVLEAEIPAAVLQGFLRARQANHHVNRACIRLAAEGVVERLLVLQEDCSEQGIHRFEQQRLLQDIHSLKLEEKVFMFNGTDESGAELLQWAMHPGRQTPLEVVWLGANDTFVARYEDRPFQENLNGHMQAMGFVPKSGAEKVLFVLPPKAAQGEASQPRTEPSKDYAPQELANFAQQIAAHYKCGRQCYLLDVDFANGGNVLMLQALAGTMPLSGLWGYASWNTASNALGTVLAQILASRSENGTRNQNFTAERILDDAIYQTLVRGAVTKRCEQAGIDVYNIQDLPLVEAWLHAEFAALGNLINTIFAGNPPEFTAKLRWPRLFEAAVFTQKAGGPVYP